MCVVCAFVPVHRIHCRRVCNSRQVDDGVCGMHHFCVSGETYLMNNNKRMHSVAAAVETSLSSSSLNAAIIFVAQRLQQQRRAASLLSPINVRKGNSARRSRVTHFHFSFSPAIRFTSELRTTRGIACCLLPVMVLILCQS